MTMTDAELDRWLREVNADIAAALNEVVDTEGDLARLKQQAITDEPPAR